MSEFDMVHICSVIFKSKTIKNKSQNFGQGFAVTAGYQFESHVELYPLQWLSG